MIGHIQTKFEVGCSTQSPKIDKNLGVFFFNFQFFSQMPHTQNLPQNQNLKHRNIQHFGPLKISVMKLFVKMLAAKKTPS